MASRHLSRSIVMQSLYEWDFFGKHQGTLDAIVDRNISEFGPGLEDTTFVRQLIEGVLKHIEDIDRIIEKAAPEWPIEQITIVDRNVLRIGLYELIYGNKDEAPPKVAINEAIELAKNFGGESSGKFINGVLGTVYKEIEKEEEKNPPQKKEEKLPEEILSGGVVYCRTEEGFKLVMIQDIFGYWTFPKGHLEEGETLEAAAERELKEEVGLENLKLSLNLGDREYKAKDPEKGFVRKKVTDFLFESQGEAELKLEKDNPGLKEVKWFSLDEISSLKQYREIKEIIQKVSDYLNQT